jgi:catechol 2,3-dioxygenase-like lactoylglutathione lyase family enzyme
MMTRTSVLTICLAAALSTGAMRATEPAPSALGLVGQQFLALSVKELEPMARWYTATFELTVLKDLPAPDGATHTRILGSSELLVELSQHGRARSLQEYAGAPTPGFLVHGFFKAGLFVKDLDRAVEALKLRGVTSLGSMQGDPPTGLRWVLFRDPGGNVLQLFEKRSPRK